MGGGSYNIASRSARAKSRGYTSTTLSNLTKTVMKQREVHPSMHANGVTVRESRDSEEHPKSLAILIGLDMTGSMGQIPVMFIKEALPNTIQHLFNAGIEHPQVAFLGIGDHECDRGILQIGQFESSDELLDKSLENLWFERNGGGNAGESYLLAWYHAAYHTSIDCFEKRGQKGFLITIGDENTLPSISGRAIERLYGSNVGQKDEYTAKELFEAASEKYHVYHINTNSTRNGYTIKNNPEMWRSIAEENLVFINNEKGIAEDISKLVITRTSAEHKLSNSSSNNVQSDPVEDEVNSGWENAANSGGIDLDDSIL